MNVALITTSSFGVRNSSPKQLLQSAGLELYDNPYGRTLSEGEVRELIRRYRPLGLIAGIEPLTEGVLREAEGLKVISRCGAGLDNVDLDAAARLGIAVFNTPEAPAQAVAELTLGLMLNLIRNVRSSDHLIRSGVWRKPMGFLLSELTVGIIGLGRIGKRVAMLARQLGAVVVGSDIAPDPDWVEAQGVRLLTKAELLRVADVLSLHLPYTSGDLYHVIGRPQLAAMRPGSYLVNTSRGGLVDEAALFDALKSGHLAAAALDTFEREPYDGPLKQLENVILTPHIGSYAREARTRMETEAAVNLIRALGGQGLLGKDISSY